MKRLLPLLLVAALGIVAVLWHGAGGTSTGKAPDLAPLRAAAALSPCPTGVGRVPDLTLPCLGGGPAVRLAGPPSGVPTLVNVYGSWCGPCQQEMPVLVAFSIRAAGRVELLGVDTEDEPRQALLFARDLGQHWPAVIDDNGTFLRHYGSGPPVTLFVDGKGEVRYVHQGAFHSLQEVQSAVQRYLKVRT